MTRKLKRGISKHTKGYLIVKAGPLRDQYLHRIVAAALIGRDLKKDEEVHHRDLDKLNFHFSNLFVLGGKDHGFVSNKQKWFLHHRDEQLKREWDQFMDEQAQQFHDEVKLAKARGEAWETTDGKLQQNWRTHPLNPSPAIPF